MRTFERGTRVARFCVGANCRAKEQVRLRGREGGGSSTDPPLNKNYNAGEKGSCWERLCKRRSIHRRPSSGTRGLNCKLGARSSECLALLTSKEYVPNQKLGSKILRSKSSFHTTPPHFILHHQASGRYRTRGTFFAT